MLERDQEIVSTFQVEDEAVKKNKQTGARLFLGDNVYYFITPALPNLEFVY